MTINLTVADVYPASFIVHNSSFSSERLVGRRVKFFRHGVIKLTNAPNNFRRQDLPEFMTGVIVFIMDGAGEQQGSAIRVTVDGLENIEVVLEGSSATFEEVLEAELESLMLSEESKIETIRQRIEGLSELKRIAAENGGRVGSKWLLKQRINSFVDLSVERGTPKEVIAEGIEKLVQML
jgi:hypothetical protein